MTWKKDLDLFDILAFFVEKMLRLHWKKTNRLDNDSIIWKLFLNKLDSLTICFQEKMTYDKLNQLEYLDLCIHETLRLYPSVTRYEYSEQHVQDNNLYKIGYYTFCSFQVRQVCYWRCDHQRNTHPQGHCNCYVSIYDAQTSWVLFWTWNVQTWKVNIVCKVCN